MHVIVVNFTVKPDFIDRFRSRMQEQAATSLAKEPNCHVFDVCLNPEAPEEVFLYEVYGSAEDFADHLASDHFKAFNDEVADWISDKQVRQLQRL